MKVHRIYDWGSKSFLNSCNVCLILMLFSINLRCVNLFLHSLDSLISEGFIFEHCHRISKLFLKVDLQYDLQNASSSSVRLYVSGYIKYTNRNSNEIHPQ